MEGKSKERKQERIIPSVLFPSFLPFFCTFIFFPSVLPSYKIILTAVKWKKDGSKEDLKEGMKLELKEGKSRNVQKKEINKARRLRKIWSEKGKRKESRKKDGGEGGT